MGEKERIEYVHQTLLSVVVELERSVEGSRSLQEQVTRAALAGNELAMLLQTVLPFLPEEVQPKVEQVLELHMLICYHAPCVWGGEEVLG